MSEMNIEQEILNIECRRMLDPNASIPLPMDIVSWWGEYFIMPETPSSKMD